MSWGEVIDMLFKDPKLILEKGGFWVLLSIVFLENGVIIGVVLPGDYLLFTAGMFVEMLGVNVWVLAFCVCISAIAGTFTGYKTGEFTGRRFLQKDTWLVKQKHIILTRAYFLKYGGKTIMYSKFLPYVRTLAPILAGVVEMPFRRMMNYNIAGAALWSSSLIIGGYYLGNLFPSLKDHIEYIIFVLIAVTTSIVVISYFKSRKRKKVKAK